MIWHEIPNQDKEVRSKNLFNEETIASYSRRLSLFLKIDNTTVQKAFQKWLGNHNQVLSLRKSVPPVLELSVKCCTSEFFTETFLTSYFSTRHSGKHGKCQPSPTAGVLGCLTCGLCKDLKRSCLWKKVFLWVKKKVVWWPPVFPDSVT